MIISKDVNPERQIYYVGGKVISIIKDFNQEIDFFEVLQKLNKDENISINLYTLALDWLFLLGVIRQKGEKLIKCS